MKSMSDREYGPAPDGDDAGRHHHHHHHHYYHQKEGEGPTASPNPHKFQRSRTNSVLGGVCGGIADYFGWKPWMVRLGMVFLAFGFFFWPVVFAYLLTWFFVKSGPTRRYETEREEQFWRAVSTRPGASVSQLRHSFRGLEGRIADMERAVTSQEFHLNKAFKEIE